MQGVLVDVSVYIFGMKLRLLGILTTGGDSIGTRRFKAGHHAAG